MNEITKMTPNSALNDYLSSAGTPLIVFRQGRFYRDKTEIPLGTRFMVYPRDHRIGLQKWVEGKPATTHMGFLHDAYIPPARETLGDLDQKLWDKGPSGEKRDPWQQSETIPMLSLENEEFVFATGSWGGHCALVALQKAYRADGSDRNPIIELATTRHQNQFGGMNDRPAFPIIGWGKALKQQQLLPGGIPPSSAELMGDDLPESVK